MARPREFEVDEAVEKAMAVFWKSGFEAASLPDLLAGMDLTRGSLYKAFGDKRSLFLTALRHYLQREIIESASALQGLKAPQARPALRRMFRSIARAVAEGDRRGCMLCNAAVELAPADAEISEIVLAGFAALDRAFADVLHTIHPDRTPADCEPDGKVLTTLYMGLKVAAKGGRDAVTLDQMAERGLAAFLQNPVRQN